MSKHAAISPGEAADRLAIRELVEAYAYCADRRDAKGQMSLFAPDTHFVVYMNAKNPTPSTSCRSRKAFEQICVRLEYRMSFSRSATSLRFVGSRPSAWNMSI
jgi:ketosteroid isomerase-like protein